MRKTSVSPYSIAMAGSAQPGFLRTELYLLLFLHGLLGAPASAESRFVAGLDKGREGRPINLEANRVVESAVLAGREKRGLQGLYEYGLEQMENGRLPAAEACFRRILAVDPMDWEAREALVRAYQRLGWKEKRDIELSVLRRMHFSGKAWRRVICRDEFVLAGKRIQALEAPSLEYPHRRRIVFGIRDSVAGEFRFLASLNRMEKRAIPSYVDLGPNAGQSIPGYRLIFWSEKQRREYFFPNQAPSYSTMKKMLANHLDGG